MATLQIVAMTLTSQLLHHVQPLVFTSARKDCAFAITAALVSLSFKRNLTNKISNLGNKRAYLGEQIKISALIHFIHYRTFGWMSICLNKGLNLSGEVSGRRKNIGDNVTSQACPSLAMNLGKCSRLF